MSKLKSQKKLIHESDWNVLIILDACRYDYFKEFYDEYFEGNLKKVFSSGGNTGEWLINTFMGKNCDFIYVSGNPHINSRGIETWRDFDATECFRKVLDAWDEGYDEDKGTIMPGHVREVAKITRIRNPHSKMLVHFNQPHEPYLSVDSHVKTDDTSIHGARGNRVKKYLGVLRRFVKNSPLGKLETVRNIFGIRDKRNLLESLCERGELREAYAKNLVIVLKEVKRLLKEWENEKVFISADHGELLGEDGEFGHKPGSENPILREVPWFEVEKTL